MLKANELRIGNLILFDGKITHANTRNIAYISNSNRLKNGDSIAFEPIKLTEEWLLKAGFEKLTSIEKGFKSNSYTYGRGFSFIVHLNNGLLSTNFWQGNEKKFLHQLQNIFFSLTGEELSFSSTEP